MDNNYDSVLFNYKQTGECPKGIIIQSSFSSLRDACYAHVLSKVIIKYIYKLYMLT